MELLTRIFHWIHWSCAMTRHIWRGQAILPLLAVRCFRATCLTVSLSFWQSYSHGGAITCHLGLFTHSVLSASAPSAPPTWITAASWWSVQTWILATAGRTWPVQAQSSNFSPGTRPSRSPTYVLSESRYMTSVQHSESESVNVRMSDSDLLPTWSH